MWSTEVLALVLAVFLLAGFVKGVSGLGLPTVSLALLTATIGLREAMVLMLIPSFATNVWQALAGGRLGALLTRLWPFLLAGVAGTWLAAWLSVNIDTRWLSALLGVVLVVYAASGLMNAGQRSGTEAGPQGGSRGRSIFMGAASGALTGLTGTFVFPAVPYFQMLGLARDRLVQAMGLWFTVATLALAIALEGGGLAPEGLSLLSLLALAPALAGLLVGQAVRRRLSEARFRQVLLVALLLLGAYIALRHLVL